MDYSCIYMYRINFPDSLIDSHQTFHIELVHQLVQPLLSVKAGPNNTLQYSAKGHKPVSTEKKLSGKHFAYKEMKRGRCSACYNEKNILRKA